MYQAIVLLPLLGSIIAAMIALAGARKRFPGAEPDDDHHAAPHGHTGRGRPQRHP
jgi:NADH-quinone oxidoreductase subunit L